MLAQETRPAILGGSPSIRGLQFAARTHPLDLGVVVLLVTASVWAWLTATAVRPEVQRDLLDVFWVVNIVGVAARLVVRSSTRTSAITDRDEWWPHAPELGVVLAPTTVLLFAWFLTVPTPPDTAGHPGDVLPNVLGSLLLIYTGAHLLAILHRAIHGVPAPTP